MPSNEDELFGSRQEIPDLRKRASQEEDQLNKSSSEEKEELSHRSKKGAEELDLQDVKDREQNRNERQKYASRIFWMIVVWLFAVSVLIVMQGLENCFSLQENTILAILGGTTLNVLGLFTLVIRYLFDTS